MEGGTQRLAEWHYQASSRPYSGYWNTTADKPERAVRIRRLAHVTGRITLQGVDK